MWQNHALPNRYVIFCSSQLVFKLLNLTVADVFADWGSGIGNTLFQAAFTVGCETKGIEVVKARNDFAKEFYDELKRLREELSKGDGAVSWTAIFFLLRR
jgi:hypothetical protein